MGRDDEYGCHAYSANMFKMLKLAESGGERNPQSVQMLPVVFIYLFTSSWLIGFILFG